MTDLAKPKRVMASLSRLERAWLKRRHCSFCEALLTSANCGAHSGPHTLPIIEGVRDKEVVVDLGPPCDMDERRAHALQHYKPRPPNLSHQGHRP
jgi:hypothetical protein